MTQVVPKELVALVRQFRADPDLELEVSASLPDHSGVHKNIYDRLREATLKDVNNGCLTLSQHDVRYIDSFYKDSIRQRKRVDDKKDWPVETIQKTRVALVKATCALLPGYTFRFHLKRERKLNRGLEPQVPLFMRAALTLSSVYSDAYEYTLRQVRQGETKEDVCKATVRYEMEIELLHDKTYLDSKSDLEIAQSMVHKALALFPSHDMNMAPVKKIMVFEECAKQSKLTATSLLPPSVAGAAESLTSSSASTSEADADTATVSLEPNPKDPVSRKEPKAPKSKRVKTESGDATDTS